MRLKQEASKSSVSSMEDPFVTAGGFSTRGEYLVRRIGQA
jgi:hypothetical protein